jgi:hypothetical protein
MNRNTFLSPIDSLLDSEPTIRSKMSVLYGRGLFGTLDRDENFLDFPSLAEPSIDEIEEFRVMTATKVCAQI